MQFGEGRKLVFVAVFTRVLPWQGYDVTNASKTGESILKVNARCISVTVK